MIFNHVHPKRGKINSINFSFNKQDNEENIKLHRLIGINGLYVPMFDSLRFLLFKQKASKIDGQKDQIKTTGIIIKHVIHDTPVIVKQLYEADSC